MCVLAWIWALVSRRAFCCHFFSLSPHSRQNFSGLKIWCDCLAVEKLHIHREFILIHLAVSQSVVVIDGWLVHLRRDVNKKCAKERFVMKSRVGIIKRRKKNHVLICWLIRLTSRQQKIKNKKIATYEKPWIIYSPHSATILATLFIFSLPKRHFRLLGDILKYYKILLDSWIISKCHLQMMTSCGDSISRAPAELPADEYILCSPTPTECVCEKRHCMGGV